jgi:hypothetical protein
MLTVKDYSKFPAIVEITTLLDCSVLEDSEYGGDTGRDRQFWLGDAGDGSVGMPSFSASPSFHTLQELNQFCRDFKPNYEEVALQVDQTGEYPDVWFWSVALVPAPKKGVRP